MTDDEKRRVEEIRACTPPDSTWAFLISLLDAAEAAREQAQKHLDEFTAMASDKTGEAWMLKQKLAVAERALKSIVSELDKPQGTTAAFYSMADIASQALAAVRDGAQEQK